jgi:hypothetical protein
MNTPTNSEALPLTNCSASWFPISTAPNSLSVILVTDGVSAWTDQKISENPDDVDGDYYFNGHENWEEVTHWMPIPSLPNAYSPDLNPHNKHK